MAVFAGSVEESRFKRKKIQNTKSTFKKLEKLELKNKRKKENKKIKTVNEPKQSTRERPNQIEVKVNPFGHPIKN